MNLRTLMLCTAMGTLFLAAPAFADPANPYNTNPTPQERAQTDQLNGNAANQAHSDADADAAARARHDADVNRFNGDSNRADADRARYERDRARYNADNGDRGRRWSVFFGADRFRDLSAMPSRDLIGLRVSTRGGSRIGTIRDVDTDGRGRITRVSIRIGGGNAAWVDADDLRFDPRSRGVFTTLSRDDVNGMAHMHNPRF